METEGQNFLASGVTSHVSACTTELTSSWELINLLAKEEHSPPLAMLHLQGDRLAKIAPTCQAKKHWFQEKAWTQNVFCFFLLVILR